MRSWLYTFCIFAPVVFLAWLTNWGAQELFDRNLLALFGALSEEGSGNGYVPIGLMVFMGFFAAIGFGSILVIWSGWMALTGQDPTPHVYCGSYFDDRARYCRADAIEDGPRDYHIWQSSGNPIPTALSSIYLRHLLLKEAPPAAPDGLENWAPLRVTSWPNALWPIFAMPFVLFFVVVFAFGPLHVVHDEGVDVIAHYATAINLLGVHMVLIGEIWAYLIGFSVVQIVVMLPIAIRTAKWSSRIRRAFQSDDEGNIRLISLPEAIGPGARFEGKIIEARDFAPRDSTGSANRTSNRRYRAVLLDCDTPFDPPILIGFRYEITRKLRKFDDKLAKYAEDGESIWVEVQDDYDMSILPLDFDGGPSPVGH